MSIPKCKLRIFATAIVTAMFAVLPVISLAQSTNFIFQPNSTFAFNPGLVPPQLFNISGTFTLNEPPNSAATITNAILGLSGDPSNLDLNVPLTSVAGVTNLLESDGFAEVASNGSQTVFQSAQSTINLGPNFNNIFSITVDNSSANRLLTFSGIGSNSPIPIFVDGSSFEFSATAVAVPEPTGLPVCLLLAITFVARRRARHLFHAS